MSTQGAATGKRNKLTTLILGIVIALVGLFFLWIFTLMFGTVAGTEFAPHSFQTRAYGLLRIPLINLQVWPAARMAQTSDLVSYLFGDAKILSPLKKTDPEFDLVEEKAGSRIIKGDARFLQRYLEGDAGTDWLAWSKANVDMAKVLWPEVQRVAHRRMYTAIPEMFHLAKQSDSPDELKKALNQHVAAHYAIIGQAEYEQGAIGAAIVLLEEAKTYAPQDPELDKLLTEVKSKAEKKAPAGG